MRMFRLLGIAALAAAPALAGAQSSTPRTVSVGVSGGASLPIGDFGDFLSTGFQVAGHVYVSPASMSSLSFRGDVAFDRWAFKDVGGVSLDGNFRSLSGTANALISMNSASAVKPYLVLGGGIFNSKGSVATETESSNDPGVQGGIGINFALSGFSTFLEAKIVNVFSSDDEAGSTSSHSARWIPITFGIRF